jgi:hypothetical protein
LPASMVMRDEEAGVALVKLERPFVFREMTCLFFVVSPRHKGQRLADLDCGKEVFCGMTRISETQAGSDKPTDLSCWRGGLGIVGSLEPIC